MKKSLYQVALLSTSLLFATSSLAAVSGNIGATSNYLWRGTTQTANSTAVQGGLDYSHDSGFYAGTWASNVDFGDSTSYELDLYAGYGGSIGEDFGYDVSYLYYAYPDAQSNIDFGEVHISGSWKWLEIGYSQVINADDGVASDPLDSKDLSYLETTLTFPITETVSIAAHYGYSSGDVVESWFGVDSYSDYNVSVSADTTMGTVSFMLSNTDLEDDDAKVVLGYSYSFDL